MPVVIVSPPGFTRKQYEESVKKLMGGKAASSPADWPVEGLLAHIAGEGPSGFRVVDVWKSREALDRFGAILMPIFAELGVKGEPEIYETLTFVSG